VIRTDSNKNFTGYIPDLLDKLASHPDCNCKFNLKLVKDGRYGVLEDRTGWNGMIGELLREVCISVVLTNNDYFLPFTVHLSRVRMHECNSF